jgi:hypothetical protein
LKAPFGTSWKREMTLFSFHDEDHLQQWTVGSDSDMGGASEAFWGLTERRTGILFNLDEKAMFWGTLSPEERPKAKHKLIHYAAIKSRVNCHLFIL